MRREEMLRELDQLEGRLDEQFGPPSEEESFDAEESTTPNIGEAEEPPAKEPPKTVERWPAPMDDAAFYGLAGDFVRTVEPHTESDPAALVVQFLAAAGNMLGRHVYAQVESDFHYGNLFVCIVGPTAGGRKGTGLGRVQKPLAIADPRWAAECINGGLSSGEGLIWCVRDQIEKTEPIRQKGRVVEYQHVTVDEGVSDKRLFVAETELASVLRVMARDGNTLSPVMRKAWDSGALATLTKSNAARATGAHVSVTGHITAEELKRNLDSTDMANGFANRFLWVCSKRSKYLPHGGNLQNSDLESIGRRLKQAAEKARFDRRITWDDEAAHAWESVYADLSDREPGLFGAVTSRAEAQTLRLSLLYAVLDAATEIRRPHLEAALAVWGYCEASARFIFGDALGDPIADRIDEALREARPGGLTRTEIFRLFQKNMESSRIERALKTLADLRRARKSKEETGGRPREIWICCVT